MSDFLAKAESEEWKPPVIAMSVFAAVPVRAVSLRRPSAGGVNMAAEILTESVVRSPEVTPGTVSQYEDLELERLPQLRRRFLPLRWKAMCHLQQLTGKMKKVLL